MHERLIVTGSCLTLDHLPRLLLLLLCLVLLLLCWVLLHSLALTVALKESIELPVSLCVHMQRARQLQQDIHAALCCATSFPSCWCCCCQILLYCRAAVSLPLPLDIILIVVD
jgi:hypothetical protein